ncbi:glutaredoxin family protein [Ureibacillus sp. FSL W8-0352]|uniref:glutaredoxin family protein n=1 Tax=Ureibacillus sp. FSL W8-0352 TaxID=2954596 RepID=UPI0030FB705F
MYSNKNCGYCVKQKEFLENHHIPFIEKDISEKKYYDELMNLGGIGTPFTVINNNEKTEIVAGFDQSKLTELLLK